MDWMQEFLFFASAAFVASGFPVGPQSHDSFDSRRLQG